MSEVRTARKRNEWLPNRMFDPTTNPFAVQNLLDRTAPPFVEQRDEVPESMFGVDPLTGGHVVGGFERDLHAVRERDPGWGEEAEDMGHTRSLEGRRAPAPR